MNTYDTVRYPTAPKEQTHPDRLAAIAAMHGVDAGPVERCRVLEVGCGNGANLIAMAYGLPEAQFTGIDLADVPVGEGNRRITELGLGNVRLRAMDLMDVAPEFGEFDYIIAHGLYSWVPPQVRDRLIAVCRANLSANGVAFVSYNAYPGCYMRRMVREMMLYHTAGIADPERRIEQARSLVSLLAKAQQDEGLRKEFEIVLERCPEVVFHDDLEEINHPVYFHQFVAHAREHGLQFLSEATLVAPDGKFDESVRSVLKPLEADPIRREQYLDFLKLRRFRETLVCRAEAAVRAPSAERVAGLWISSPARAEGAAGPGGAVEFKGPQGAAAKTAHPLAKAALDCLGRAWPRRFRFEELLTEARQCGGLAPGGEDAAALKEILWYTVRAGLVHLHAHPGRFVMRAGERPEASALARMDLQDGEITATLAHGVVEVGDATGRRLVQLLDGTRNRATLAVELDVPLAAVENGLAGLARIPLLVA